MRRWTSLLLSILLWLPVHAGQGGASPRNVILLIGDGMGVAQVRAAGMFANGQPGTLCFETFAARGEMTTHSADAGITDSAASATAMATGHKVNNGVISIDLPGNGQPLRTALEHFKREGKSTGLVTTTFLTHATPAAFAAHANSREDYPTIARDYLNVSRPNVLFGGMEPTGRGVTPQAALAADYTVATTRKGMNALRPGETAHVAGLFGLGHMPYEWTCLIGLDNGYDLLPHLSEMTEKALELLDHNEKGLFLMVEGGRIDHACHGNAIEAAVFETIEFARAVSAVVKWAGSRDDTLIIVTADHETGGLTVGTPKGRGRFPEVTWSTTGHTGGSIPVYARGPRAGLISGVIDNTDIFRLMTREMVVAPSGSSSALPSKTPQHGGADVIGVEDRVRSAKF